MKYLTYSGNTLVNARLPADATIFYPPPPLPGIPARRVPQEVRRSFEQPLGMPPLRELVGPSSRVLIAFDDNCQPFPLMRKPDIRQSAIETLLEMLYSYGVQKSRILLICAVALHRKMKKHELAYMLGPNIMRDYYPERLRNFDAEDRDTIVELGETEQGEVVEIDRAVAESDLVIYVDANQIPLNGGHKSVAVGLGTYKTIAYHHAPQMTAENPHVMQPHNSNMHASIERMSRLIEKHTPIMVMEAPMNGAIYPPLMSFLSKSPARCNSAERLLKSVTPAALKLVPEGLKFHMFKSMRPDYEAVEINAGSIDAVHERTLAALEKQLVVETQEQYDTLVFGLPDMSPYSIDARINPVLVVSDVLGYVFNWFYNRPFLKKGGVVIILNPVYEVFHPDYHAAYKKFWDEVLPETTEPFQMQERFQERFASDPELIHAYRHRWAHHGFHPFTVWYWATYPLRYLSGVILVGPKDDRVAKRLGVGWSPSLEHALGKASEMSGGGRVLALTIPPFMYLNVQNGRP